MGARSDICHAVRTMEKSSQMGTMYQTMYAGRQNPVYDANWRLSRTHALKGMAKGVKELVPGAIDYTLGPIAGISNGAFHMFGEEPFMKSYHDSRDWVTRNYADPIRKAEMAIGGNMVKNMFDSASQQHTNSLRTLGVGEEEILSALRGAKSVENLTQISTELGASLPFGAKSLYDVSRRMTTRLGPKASRVIAGTSASIPVTVPVTGMSLENDERVKKEDLESAKSHFEDVVSEMLEADPSSREYSAYYKALEKSKHLSPNMFNALPAPTYVPDNANVSQETSKGPQESAKASPYVISNGMQGVLAGGGIGSLLGLLFGGKGGWWKLGLLGALLGGFHGYGGPGGLAERWNSLKGMWNKSQ